MIAEELAVAPRRILLIRRRPVGSEQWDTVVFRTELAQGLRMAEEAKLWDVMWDTLG